MKIAVVTEEDLFYVREFFREFYSIMDRSSYEIAAVTILPPFNKKSTLSLARQMYGFYGPLHFVRVGFSYLFRKLSGLTIRELTKKNNFQLVDVDSVNSETYINWLKSNSIDAVVSIAAPEVFKKPLLDSVPMGCINSHSALLPENRGMMPVFWGLFKGDPEIGVTVHTMEEELDRGEILMQEVVPVGGESLHEMIIKTKKISANLINETLKKMADGSVERRAVASGGSYQTFPTPAEVKEFKRRGKRLF